MYFVNQPNAKGDVIVAKESSPNMILTIYRQCESQ